MTDGPDMLLPDLSEDPYFDKNNGLNADSRKSKAIAELLSRDVASRAESAEEIACMANSYLLAPHEIREDKVISVENINEPASNAFRELRRKLFEYTGDHLSCGDY